MSKPFRTKCETAVARELQALDVLAAQRVAYLPGKPDFVVPSLKLAIFVHGCFWHGCIVHYKTPRTRALYWRGQMNKRRATDQENARKLAMQGYTVAVIWEHELANVRSAVQSALAKAGWKGGATDR